MGTRTTLPRRRFLHLAAGAVALPALARIAHGQAYPSGPVRIVVPFAPAGPNDIIARALAQWLGERLGQPFVIENRSGAASNVGTEAVVNAAPDGYTVLMVSSPQAINATLYDKLHFEFRRDIAPVAAIMRVPNVISSIMPKRIPTSSISRRQVSARPTTCPGNCSRS
jgi:tripartite-type tricarboxylate transporter receptor subunit TctC